VKIYQRQRRE